MARNLVYIIMDSCRFDSYAAALTPNFDKIGKAQQRFSYASWTSPSHYTILMGLMPHESPSKVFASEVYKSEFGLWVDRLAIPGLSFASFVPWLSLPKVLKENGYRTIARVSLPVLNPYTSMNQNFDDYRLMDDHNDFAGMVSEVEFPGDEPRFYFFNLGETHYPYMLDGSAMPHISGVHGVFKHMGDKVHEKPAEEQAFFGKGELKDLHDQQARCVEYVDSVFGTLWDKLPSDTHVIITADHGECFGEDGYFGHGPIMHRKVFEVPFLEGVKP